MRFILKFQLELVRRRSSFSEGIGVLQNSCKISMKEFNFSAFTNWFNYKDFLIIAV